MNNQAFCVLLVDDIADMRELIALELESLGVQIFHASSGEEAFLIFKKNKIDFIVTDVNMPNGNGLQLIRRINDHHLKLPPTILMTGYSNLKESDFRILGVVRIFENLLDVAEIKNIVFEHMKKKKDEEEGKPYNGKAS